MNMSFDVKILNFSGIYEEESFYRSGKSSHFIDLSDIPGTNCMCDEAALKEIGRRIFAGAGRSGAPGGIEPVPRAGGAGDSIEPVPAAGTSGDGIKPVPAAGASGDGIKPVPAAGTSGNGIKPVAAAGTSGNGSTLLPYGLNFLDNGNYHYMSAILLEQVKEPFSLVVLDHHPDMQRPMFDILSCGGWVLDVAEKNTFVRDIHIIGADRKLISELEENVRQRAFFYDPEDVFYDEGGEVKIKPIDSSFPLYLSVDKDVILRDEIATNWDQGELSSRQVLKFMEWAAGCDKGLLGVDVCGECAADGDGGDFEADLAGNSEFNQRTLELFENFEYGI